MSILTGSVLQFLQSVFEKCHKTYILTASYCFKKHSSLNDKKRWKDEFNGPLFFPHTAKQILATGFCRKNSFDLIDQKSDENGQILIIEAKLNKDDFTAINIYNFNTESEQIKTFSTL